MLMHIAVADAGDIDVVPGDNVASYSRLEARLGVILAKAAVPLTIGGDHGISYPAVRAVCNAGDAPLGLIVFDTHLDLSETFGGDRLTRASPLLRIAGLDKVDPRRIVAVGARGPRNLPEWTPLQLDRHHSGPDPALCTRAQRISRHTRTNGQQQRFRLCCGVFPA